MNNIPMGYNLDGEYLGEAVEYAQKEQRFVKVSLTPEELEVLDKGLTQVMLEGNFPPADREQLDVIISASEKVRLARAEYERQNKEID
jgi:hypothetical protein